MKVPPSAASRVCRWLLVGMASGGILRAEDPSAAETHNFLARVAALREEARGEELAAYLQSMRPAMTGNPDYVAITASFWWNEARQGGMGLAPDPEAGPRTLTLLRQGVDQFPTRLDLWLALAYVQQESGQGDEAARTLLDLLERSRRKPGDLVWKGGGPLPEPPERFIPGSIHRHASGFFEAQTPEDDRRAVAVAESLTKVFPAHPGGHNLLAAIARARGDEEQCRKHLLAARQADPGDPVTAMNLAEAWRRAGQTPTAVALYREVAGSPRASEELQQEASAAATELESPPGGARLPAAPPQGR